MTTKTLIFFLDAIRPDYINKEDTPFLFDFKNKNTYLDMKSLLGYSSGIHPSLWSGNYQNKHNHFLVYSYSENNNYFAWLKYLSFLPKKVREYFLGILKAPFYMSKIPKKIYPRWYFNKILAVPATIDPKIAKFFKKEKFEFENSFKKILIKNNLKFRFITDRDNENYGQTIPLKDWGLSEEDIEIYFSWEGDILGHYPGPKSERLRKILKIYDQKIRELYQKALKKYGVVNMFIFSDHGMVEVDNTIDVKSVIERSDLVPIKDYIVFYDSTMVRFWTKNKKVREKIISLLSEIDNLTFLDETLKKKYKIDFKTRKWGDIMFLVDPGFRIFPDYFAPVRFNTKGMHGYWPEYNNSKGIFLTNTFKTNKKEINIVDIMPTMLKVLGLEKSIPKDIDGKSIY